MKRKQSAKLQLSKETLSSLVEKAIAQAVGGTAGPHPTRTACSDCCP